MDESDPSTAETNLSDQSDSSMPEFSLPNQPDSSTKSNPTDKPGLSELESTDTTNLIPLESDTDDPSHPPKKKRKSILPFASKSPKRKAEKQKKSTPLPVNVSKSVEDEPKRKQKPSPLKLSHNLEGEKIDEPTPGPSTAPSSPLKRVIKSLQQLKVGMNKGLVKVRESFNNHNPVRSPFSLFDLSWSQADQNNLSPFSIQAAYDTHCNICLIRETLYFELSIHKIPENKEILKQLGYCVKFISHRCTVKKLGQCLRCPMAGCKVCPHQFECDCSPKFINTKWCVHLHLAKRLELHKYGGQACLFVKPSSANPTADRHLRAFVQGEKKMWEASINLYYERFEYLERSNGFKVTIAKNQDKCECPPSRICKSCNACWCQWVCNCPDYWLYNQVCEHLHLVAMLRHERREELFKELGDYGQNDQFPREEWQSGMDMELQHDMRFYYLPAVKITELSANKWTIEDFEGLYKQPDGKKEFIVTANDQKDTLCICGNREKANVNNFCIRCNICIYHYTCTCERSKTQPICHHMHLVARFQSEKRAKNEEARKKWWEMVEHYNEILDVRQEQLDIKIRDTKFDERRPVGLVSVEGGLPQVAEHAEAGPSQTARHVAGKGDPCVKPKDEYDRAGSSQAAEYESGKGDPYQ